MKVTLVGINNVDKPYKVVSLSLKIELKVKTPGFNKNPDKYLKVFNKLKLKIKT